MHNLLFDYQILFDTSWIAATYTFEGMTNWPWITKSAAIEIVMIHTSESE